VARTVWEGLPWPWSGSGSGFSWRPLAWSIVPGLGHIRYSNRLTGTLLLAGWAGMLALAAATLGSGAGAWFVAVAVAIHATALLLFLAPAIASLSAARRALVGLILFLGLRYVLYAPVGWLGQRFYVPFPVQGSQPGGVIRNGDGVLVEGPWIRPDRFQRGDLVLYRIQNGFGLDRVVGVPGDEVSVQSGVLKINGRVPAEAAMPLGGLAGIHTLQIHVNPGEYVVFPSQLSLQVLGPINVDAVLAELCRVRENDVVGRAVLRTYPWSRFGRVH